MSRPRLRLGYATLSYEGGEREGLGGGERKRREGMGEILPRV